MTLIGPKPDVDMPKLPTPWKAVGDAIADANGRCILVVNGMIDHADRIQIANVVAGAINRDHGQQDDELTVKLVAVWRDDA